MNKEKLFINALSIIARDKNETIEIVFSDFLNQCKDVLQYQYEYSLLSTEDKYHARIDRNEKIVSTFALYRQVNAVSETEIFDFDMPMDIRIFERGIRIDSAIKNIIDVTRFAKSDKIQKLLRECI